MADTQAGSSRDPYQLDRLAEELVTRELTLPDAVGHDLPTYVPLSHDNPYLTADAFNIEQFLLSRSYTSLQDLRTELREYLSTLKEELVRLINDDYEAFISLSTDLRGEGIRLNKLKAPLGGLRQEIQASKAQLQTTQDAIQQKLENRAVLREEKALLHLLLKISESVTRLEGLLLISSPSDGDETPIEAPNLLISSTLDGADDKSRGNQAKHLSRVAAEYTQLLYHVEKAREDECAFVEEIQWRIDRLQSTLSSDLDHHFSTLLHTLTEGKAESRLLNADQDRLQGDLQECLRTYDVLGLWRDAEDILRRDVVRRFVKKTIFSGSLTAPQSPVVPHTPFNSSALSPSPHPPKTPYTPFTAFPKSFPSTSSVKGQNPYLAVLEESDEPLAKLYCQLLRFAQRDLRDIMKMAEKVAIKSYGGKATVQTAIFSVASLGSAVSVEGKGFQILANVVWDELGRALMDELGSVVFSVGKPGIFRMNYETTQVFIRALEWLAPSEHAVEALRKHPVYAAFERRWQLPVYFQMRWKEIVTKLEDTLGNVKIETAKGDTRFMSAQGAAVADAISTCWNPEVYIKELGHRFWRLSLQLISRYKTWLDDSITNIDRTASALPSGVTPRSATPVHNGEVVDTTRSDDAQLRHCATVILDVGMLETFVLNLWREQINRMLPNAEGGGDEAENEAVLRHSISKLFDLIPSIESRIVSILSTRCSEALSNIRSIPTQFRSDRNKRPLTGPSKFVPDVLRPVKSFFVGNGVGAALPSELRVSMQKKVFDRVLQRYFGYIVELKKIEDPLRRLKRNKKPTFSLFGNANAGKDDEDDERIKIQMVLDVEAFGKDALSLGVSVDGDEGFESLHQLVKTFDSE